MSEKVHIYDRPLMIGEVAQYYGVSTRTVRRWLQRAGLSHLVQRRNSGSRYYTIAELQQIAEAIGE